MNTRWLADRFGRWAAPVVVAISCVALLGGFASGREADDDRDSRDAPETGLQGQVPIADQISGRSLTGYHKGMKLISQNTLLDRGANMQMTTYKHCAYVDNGSAISHPLQGIAVLDVRDPASPKLTKIVSSTDGINSWEGLKASEKGGYLLAFYSVLPPPYGGGQAAGFDVYDISSNCLNPVKVATVSLADLFPTGGHGMRLSNDGRTAYISAPAFPSGTSVPATSHKTLAAFDLSKPSQPKLLATWNWADNPQETIDFGFHDGTISADDKTLYWGTVPLFSTRSPLDVARVLVQAFDLTEIQNRRPNPSFKLLGQVNFEDCGGVQAHTVRYARVKGKPYVFAGAECTGIQYHAIDVSDPTNMKIVSTFTTEASDPANASKVAPDNVLYFGHYTGVDDVSNATTLFVTWYGSGLRALDIRDPTHIEEFAYLNPPAHPNNVFCGFGCATTHEVLMSDVNYDAATGNIWFAGVNGGFYVAHITESAGPNGLRFRSERD